MKRVAGSGAGYWPPGVAGVGPCAESELVFLGPDSTVNVAEYSGALSTLRRAVRSPSEPCVFEFDSQVITNQIRATSTCREPTLLPLYVECRQHIRELALRGQKYVVRWIYRDFNTTADALANAAVLLAPNESPKRTPGW